MRSVAFKHAAEHTMSTVASFAGKRGSATNTFATDVVAAAKNLFHHLHNGFTGQGVHRVLVAGDTTRLPFANGLTSLERRLAWAQHYLAQNFGGSQQVRQLMGHCQWGARVVYGDCLFFTISPNEQHSALVLRLSRFRKNDPYVQSASQEWGALASADYPKLEAKRPRPARARGHHHQEHGGGRKEAEEECFIDFPSTICVGRRLHAIP